MNSQRGLCRWRSPIPSISLISATLDNPEKALAGFDTLYRTGQALTEQTIHLLQTYELFVALVAKYTSISVPTLYYVLFPMVSASLAILANWVLMRRFLDRWQTIVG